MTYIPKSYIYKVYRNGIYLGDLPNVTSEFKYSQDINSAGSQTTIVVGESADTSGLAPDNLTAEDDTLLTAEDGTQLTTERAPEIIGNNTPGILVRNGNKVKVWEFSNYTPNGKVMFSGDIERWEAGFGGSQSSDQITLYIYSDGQELGNYVIPGSNSLFVDQQQTAQNDWFGTTNFGIAGGIYAGQEFVVGAGVTNIAAITVHLATGDGVSQPVTLYLWNNVNEAITQAVPLATSTQTITSGVDADYQFIFSAPINAIPGGQYFFAVGRLDDLKVYINDADVYMGGSFHIISIDGSGHNITALSQDVYFRTYYSSLTTQKTFTSEDPSNIFKDIIDNYRSQGGLLNYSTGTIDLTGISTTYTFALASILEGIQVCSKLSPYTWYWYVDLGTNILYFKNASTTADFTLTKGIDIADLDLVATTENVKNKLFFSGGDTGSGLNLFTTYSDTTSIINNGIRLDRQSDNRVTLQGTADTIGSAFIATNKDEQYQTIVVITDQTRDISLFKPGKIIGFRGFGTFVDSLLIQIVRIDYTPDNVTLTLGALPPRLNATIQQALADINAIQTVANPDIPS